MKSRERRTLDDTVTIDNEKSTQEVEEDEEETIEGRAEYKLPDE